MRITKIEDPQEKSRVCEKILRSLPQWFGIESAILDYIKDVQTMETWAAIDSNIIGFVSLKKHNPQTAEVHVMGVLPEFHGKKVGTELIRAAEESLHSQGFKFLTAKTLSESRPDVNYDKTRKFYLRAGFTPLEEFKNLWGEHNPCLMMVKAIAVQQYAVIFSSKRNDKDAEGYEQAAQKMLELAKAQDGFLGVESSRDSQGFGITVSYWRSQEAIKAWKSHAEHLEAQEQGRIRWYDSFTTMICRVERKYSFKRGNDNG